MSIPVTIIPPQPSPTTVTFVGRMGQICTEQVDTPLAGTVATFDSFVNDTHSAYLVRTSFSQFFSLELPVPRAGNFTARKNREIY